MEFLGQYTLNIEDGAVYFPWEAKDGERLIWMLSEITNDDKTSVYCEICSSEDFEKGMKERESHVEKIKILSKGEFTVDEDSMWKVPDEIREYLKTDEINFIGGYFCAEIFSSQEMDEMYAMIDETLELAEIIITDREADEKDAE